MRIEIWDAMNTTHRIDSQNFRLLGDWFAEHASRLMSAEARMQNCRINVWPETHEEMDLIGQHDASPMSQDGLLHLAETILEASKKLADQGQ